MGFRLAVVSPSDLGSRHVSGSIVPIAATVTCLLLLSWQRRLVVPRFLSLLRWGRAVRRRESARQTVLTATEVIKRQLPAVSVIEAEKTRRAGAVARRTGLFDVPEIVGGRPEAGQIVFERIGGVVPLWTWLVGRRRGDGCQMAARAGRALAAIHDSLRLPVDLGESLAAPWRVESGCVAGMPITQDHEVALHGDFNAWNLLVADKGRRLLVTDWAASDLCGPRVVRGPWVFDAAWLVITLFRSRWGWVQRIDSAEAFANAFLESYAEARHLPEAPAVCGAYLASRLSVLSRPEIRGRRGQWLRPKLNVERLERYVVGLANARGRAGASPRSNAA